MSTPGTSHIHSPPPDDARPYVAGIHHLKIAVSDLAVSLPWYERALGASRLPQYDHVLPGGDPFAYILKIPGLGTLLELRMAPAQAARQAGFDPIVLATETLADLQRWAAYFDECGIEHSGVLRGILGWLLVCRDPDGLSVRFYSHESHEFDALNADIDSPWVSYPATWVG